MKKPLNHEVIEYKKLNSNDLEMFRNLNEVFAIAFEDPVTHLSQKPKDQYLVSLLDKSHFIAIAALADKTVVGGLVAYVLEKYEQERSEIYIYDLAVDEKFRRRGIARQLINELKRVAGNIGAWVIFVQADKEDAPAIKLYQSMGIQEEPFHFDISVSL
jgi:aminoglycoside 3-N-acetyltransferase I